MSIVNLNNYMLSKLRKSKPFSSISFTISDTMLTISTADKHVKVFLHHHCHQDRIRLSYRDIFYQANALINKDSSTVSMSNR